MNKFIYFLMIVWFGLLSVNSYVKIVVVIDVGYGGKDFGVIGKKFGIKEKDVMFVIVKELKVLFDVDFNFKVVMICKMDIFV